MTADNAQFKYVFGPIASRRLGRSLGIDLVPFKVCPLDCIYCQLGRTTVLTAARQPYVPAQEVLAELRAKLASGPPCDYITLSGSGEPTLHSQLGEIIDAIKAMTKIPLAVLTNGVLMDDPAVRQALLKADVVIPDLDAGDEATFRRVNRPCQDVSFRAYVAGLRAFRRQYQGQIWLEVFLVAGVNDSDRQIADIKAVCERIGPDHIDLNTIARPPAEQDARPVSPERLRQVCAILGPKARIIATVKADGPSACKVTAEDVLAAIRRHPSTLQELAFGLSAEASLIAQVLDELTRQGQITRISRDGKEFFQAGK